ncbi:MAG: hypothetical protein ACR2OD_00265 [Gaiellaceae bacterium]
MAKRKKSGKKPAQRRRKRAPRPQRTIAPPPEEPRNKPLFNLKPEPVTEERRAILAQVPAWARALRMRSGLAIGLAVVAAVIAYNVGGRVAGPAVAGFLMLGVGFAMWRADKLEGRARERMESGH